MLCHSTNHGHGTICLPLSNPTEKAECTPKHAYEWTDGKALVAAGVQFPDVEINGKTFHPGQANNFYIFPALGLAVYATKAKKIDDKMFIAGARGCADCVSKADRRRGMLYPPQREMLNIETRIAIAIARDIFDRGLAGVDEPEDLSAMIQEHIYEPSYDNAES